MAFQKGERYRCSDSECGCEIDQNTTLHHVEILLKQRDAADAGEHGTVELASVTLRGYTA